MISSLAIAPLFLTFFTASPFLRCDPAWLPISRDPAVTALVVRMEPDTVRDIAQPRFAAKGPVREFEAAVRGERGPLKSRYGQRARLLQTGAENQLSRDSTVVLVPWEFVSDCGPAPWSGSARWAPVGEAAFVTAWLRPRASWVDGVPTFDVEVRGWQPVWRANEPRWGRASDLLLTPAEFLLLYEGLPSHNDVEKRDPVRRAIAELRRRLAGLAIREPALTILGNLDRHLASLK